MVVYKKTASGDTSPDSVAMGSGAVVKSFELNGEKWIEIFSGDRVPNQIIETHPDAIVELDNGTRLRLQPV